MDRPRRSLPKPNYCELEHLRTSPRKRKTEDPISAESKMRKRHQEEAAEMARLNNELASLKSDTVVTAQLNHKVVELTGHIRVLKDINYDLMVERARHCNSARKMQKLIEDTKKELKAVEKSVEDAKNETEAMRTRLEDMWKVYAEVVRDRYYERDKRMQAEQTLQELLAAQKAIAEKFGVWSP